MTDGKGLPLDYAEALKWDQKAADQGLDVAQHTIGDMYFNGKGVTQNNAEALKWYRKVTDQGHEQAKKRRLVLNMFQFQED
ncbi:MAG: tetratricopeptide repeat protein [Desulfomonilaceae bacterium]